MISTSEHEARLQAVTELSKNLANDLNIVSSVVEKIRLHLQTHVSSKTLKGGEITGWLGEVYAKLWLGGTIVDDTYEYDVVTGEMRVAVKARRDTGGPGWKTSSVIPRIEGEDVPTHLMFVRLDRDYSLGSLWLFPWPKLVEQNRFTRKRVRGGERGWTFSVNPATDSRWLFPGGEEWPVSPSQVAP